jgi:hypothetical protein
MSTQRQHRRLDKIKAQANSEEDERPWVVFGPQWAEKEDVHPPPDELNEPVYSEEYGWMEKDDAIPGAFIWVHGPQDSNEDTASQ